MSALVVALGVTALVGWHVHSPRITQWLAGKTPMVYNTAISFVILGAALLAASLGRRRLTAAVAAGGDDAEGPNRSPNRSYANCRRAI